MTDGNILSLITFLPLVGALIILVTRGDEATVARNARYVALWTTSITFVVSLYIWWKFDPTTADFQFVQKSEWLGGAINYHMGVDGISMLFVILTTFLMPACILASWTSIEKRVKEYMIAFLVLETLMIGVFCALDLVLFYVFFELTLVPMYFIVGVWGGDRRIYAAVKFFLYTALGSLLMLVGILYLYWQAWQVNGVPSFHFLDLLGTPLSLGEQLWLFGAFALAFAIKVPIFPLHTWLPDAHVEAPTPGSVVLAAVLLKMGTYGFLRFVLPFFPEASAHPTVALVMISLGVAGIIYAALVAAVQPDAKKLVAYTSVAHMGFVVIGIFALTVNGLQGGLIVMISHGISTGALFLLLGMPYERRHTREIDAFGGLAKVAPLLATALVLTAMASIGVPGTSGFVGEFMVVLGAVQFNFWVAFLAATTLILGAAYSLWMYKRVVFGEVANDHVAQLDDINGREFAFLAILAFCVLAMGVYPFPFTEVMHASVDELLRHIAVSKL
mgnify:CR=1 FL=1